MTAALVSAAMLGTMAGAAVNAEENTIIGDVNADGVLSASDFAAFQYYLLTGDETEINLENADMSKDGNVNILDFIMLKKHFLDGDEEPVSENNKQNEWKYNTSGLDVSKNGVIVFQNGAGINKIDSNRDDIVTSAELSENKYTINESCTLTGQFNNLTIEIEPENDNDELWINLYNASFDFCNIIVNDNGGRKVFFYLPQGDNFTSSDDSKARETYINTLNDIGATDIKAENFRNSLNVNGSVFMTQKYNDLCEKEGLLYSLSGTDFKNFYSDEEEAAENMVPDLYICSAENGTKTEGPEIKFINLCGVTGQILCPDSKFTFTNSAIIINNCKYFGCDMDENYIRLSVLGKVDVGAVEKLQNDFGIVYLDHENTEDPVGFRVRNSNESTDLEDISFIAPCSAAEILGYKMILFRNPFIIEDGTVIKAPCAFLVANGKFSFSGYGNNQIRFKDDLFLLNDFIIDNSCVKSDYESGGVPAVICEGDIYYNNKIKVKNIETPVNIFANSIVCCKRYSLNYTGGIYCYGSDPDFDRERKIEELKEFEAPEYNAREFEEFVSAYAPTEPKGSISILDVDYSDISGNVYTKGSLIIKGGLTADEVRADEVLLINSNNRDINVKRCYAKGGIVFDDSSRINPETEFYTTYYEGDISGIDSEKIHIVPADDPCFEWPEYNEMP